ncbi:MAG: hypothetical protein JM58_12300 [Peptococcaceae bacterium BICA1-8]|nr:MAG: hypothetical protein JM58_12300 [Peptococcaceae bacterium BICA1-8]
MNSEIIIKTLKIHAETAKSLKSLSRHNINFQLWLDRTTDTIENAFGLDSEFTKKFKGVQFHVPNKSYTGKAPFDYDEARDAYLKGLNKAINIILECINYLDDNLEIKVANNSHIRCEAGKEHIDFNIHLSLSDIDEYLDKSKINECEKGLVKKELQEIYAFLGSGEVDKNKVELYKNKLANILNQLTIQTGILICLFQVIDIIDKFTY